MRSLSKDGSANETMILKTLDNRRFKDLSEKWQRHMKRMFKDIKDDDLIYVNYYEFKDAKPDLEIIVNKRRIFLSIKSGHAPAMHYENTHTFMPFLRSLGVPERIIKIIYFYHYGYVLGGKEYKKAYTRDEILEHFPNLIKEVNEYFASHDEIITEIIYRSIIRGRLKRDLVDYFYYGNAARGYLLSLSDIMRLIIEIPNDLTKTLCFKQLTYVAVSRDKDNPRRHDMKVHWPALCRYFYDENFMKRYG